MLTEESILIGDISKKSNEPIETAEICLSEDIRVPYSFEKDATILDTLLDAGHDVPFSCQAGVCTSCIAEVEEGCVVQEDSFCLTEEDVEAGKTLTCQARPASARVRIRFIE